MFFPLVVSGDRNDEISLKWHVHKVHSDTFFVADVFSVAVVRFARLLFPEIVIRIGVNVKLVDGMSGFRENTNYPFFYVRSKNDLRVLRAALMRPDLCNVHSA